MYNGIGLTTARGSGTNGYVVRNLSHVRPPPIQNKQKGMDHRGPPPPVKKPNKDLILHDLKRKVEVQCMELRLSMEDDGADEATIDTKVDALRQSLLSRLDDMKPREAKNLQEHETHLLQAAKAEENIKFANAFGIRHEDHVEGQAFDRELQEQKKQERMERRRLEMEKQLERHERDEKAARRRHRSSRDDDRRRRRRRSPSYSSTS
ncbi:hypothetical protein [Absidia glauca]|uniref:CWF21 domain-containing protein n=1 Tax=Absidia glauca TaxID=4829 RepID=A0A163K778_ABSGL|nr:hypothetical protein [Absidia glauca]